jgi:hypothetical protein
LIDLSPTRLAIEIERKSNTQSRCPALWMRSSSTRCSAS